MEYAIDNADGKVSVSQEGLYYHFRCRCRLQDKGVCRLIVECDGKEQSLGILIPGKQDFELETRIPIKRIGTGSLTFHLMSNTAGKTVPAPTQEQHTFVPIYPEEPFSYLERLKDSFLVIQNGQKGILITPQETRNG